MENKLNSIETKLDALFAQNTAIRETLNRLNLFLSQNTESMKQFSDSIIMHINLVKEIGNKLGSIDKILKSLKK